MIFVQNYFTPIETIINILCNISLQRHTHYVDYQECFEIVIPTTGAVTVRKYHAKMLYFWKGIIVAGVVKIYDC